MMSRHQFQRSIGPRSTCFSTHKYFYEGIVKAECLVSKDNLGTSGAVTRIYKDCVNEGLELTPVLGRSNKHTLTAAAAQVAAGRPTYESEYLNRDQTNTNGANICKWSKLPTPLVHHRDYSTNKRAYL